MAEPWVNADGVRPADTAKFGRRIDAALALGFQGLRVSSANSNYGPEPGVYDTAGVDAWVDACAPSGLKNRIIISPSWNYGHANWIAVAGTYGVNFPSYNRPPLATLNHIVSRDSSLLNRWATRWVQKGGRAEDLSVELHGEDLLWGVLGPRESATLTAIANNGLIGVRDTAADWDGALGFPGAIGIVEWMEAYCPIMDWSGMPVIAPVAMGHIYTQAQSTSAGTGAETGPWPIRAGNTDGVKDSLHNEFGASGLLRYVDPDAPWWSTIPRLEWQVGAYLGGAMARALLSPREVGRMYRTCIAQRTKRLRAYLAAQKAEMENLGVPHASIDPSAAVHVYEFGHARGWVTGSQIFDGPRRTHSEAYWGEVISAMIEQVSALSDIETAAFFDLENRASSQDVPSGYNVSYALMDSTGALSVGASSVARSLGLLLDTSEDSPTGAWWT